MDIKSDRELSPLELLRWLEQRGRAIAISRNEAGEAHSAWRGLGFRLGEVGLAAPFGEVVEVLRTPPVTQVPGAKAWVRGLANVRGRLLPIMDLRHFFFGMPARLSRQERTLVIETHDMAVGLVVDEVLGVRQFLPDERMEHWAEACGRLACFVHTGFIREGATWGVFSFHDLLETPGFMQVAA